MSFVKRSSSSVVTHAGIPPSYHDHFFGFSRWTKNCLPYRLEDPVCVWTWMDGDCIFQNGQTKDIHLIELKCQDAKAKAYQLRILNKLEALGVKIHRLRLQYDPWYNGDHECLGDPRYSKEIELDGQKIEYAQLLAKLLEWHGFDPNLDLNKFLHKDAVPKIKKMVADF